MSNIDKDCFFCNRAKKESIFSSKFLFVVRDNKFPVTKYHTLIAPHRHVSDFFEMPNNVNSPYMILSGEVKKEKRNIIPAVTHADNTARVHTVSSKVNQKYWNLINEFKKITGVPVLLNTSFNGPKEPIVEKPAEAIDFLVTTKLDVLYLDGKKITRK